MLEQLGFSETETLLLFDEHDADDSKELDLQEFTHLYEALRDRVASNQCTQVHVDLSDKEKVARLRREHEQAKRALDDRLEGDREAHREKIRQRRKQQRSPPEEEGGQGRQLGGAIRKKVSLSAAEYKDNAWLEASDRAHGIGGSEESVAKWGEIDRSFQGASH
jgi:hypothetical protein